MLQNSKKRLISVYIAAAAVIVCSAMSCNLNSHAVNEYRTFTQTNLSGITVESACAAVEIRGGTGTETTLALTGNTAASQILFATNIDNNVLKVECDSSGLWSDLKLVITVPNPNISTISVKTVASGITLSDCNATTVDLKCVSGSITANNIKGNTNAYTVSGKIAITYADTVYVTNAESVSGGITISIPQSVTAFSFGTHTTSGGRSCGFSYTGNMDNGQVGTGGPHVYCETVSGGIQINRI